MKSSAWHGYFIGGIIGVFITAVIMAPVNVGVDEYYQQGWCDGASEAITANYDLWGCYNDFGDFFFINESKWNVSCYDEKLPGYMEMGYRMAGCKGDRK